MPGATFVQANSANYGDVGAGGDLPCAYTDPNGLGNIGLLWIVSEESEPPTTVTDTNDNTWYLLPSYTSETGFNVWYVCPSLHSGANTVTVSTCDESAFGGPTLVVLEFEPPPCPLGACGIQAMQPQVTGSPFSTVVLENSSQYSASTGQFYHTLIVALWDQTNGFSDTARTWSAVVPGDALGGGICIQFGQPSGNNTGVIAYAIVAYPAVANSVGFEPSPGTPAIDSREVKLSGVLISAVS